MRSITLAYTFFRTGEAEVLDPETDARKRAAAAGAGQRDAPRLGGASGGAVEAVATAGTMPVAAGGVAPAGAAAVLA